MKNKTKIAPAVTPMEYTQQQFIDAYVELCKKMGYQLVAEPRWAQSKDSGDYRLIVQMLVVKSSDNL